MKTIFILLMFSAANAFAFSTVELQKCAQGTGGPISGLDGLSKFQSSGIDIYRVSADKRWGSLSTAIFKDKERQLYCYKIGNSSDFLSAGRLEKKKKSEMKSVEIKACEAHQLGAQRISKAEGDEILLETIQSYALDMAALIHDDEETNENKLFATKLIRNFEVCEALQPGRINSEFRESLETAQDNRDQLVSRFKIQRSSITNDGKSKKSNSNGSAQ